MLFWMHALFFMLRVQGAGGSFPPPLRTNEEQDCLTRMAQGDTAARDQLIEHNLRLVAHIVKKYYADPSEQDDLISIGTIGLIKAVSTYQPDKGVRLATYAARCIENEILMYFRAGRKSQNDVSLDESPDSDGDSNSLALLGTISVEDERLHLVEMSDRYQTMYDCLSRNLSPREKHILTLRYGLNGHDPLPQREVAAALGISRSYVSRRAYCKCIEKQPASESSDVGCFRLFSQSQTDVCFIKSAMVYPSKNSLTNVSNACHMGSVRQSAARGQGAASRPKQETGAKSPSVRRMTLPTVYCSGALLSL